VEYSLGGYWPEEYLLAPVLLVDSYHGEACLKWRGVIFLGVFKNFEQVVGLVV
jgi:hypothetical protein